MTTAIGTTTSGTTTSNTTNSNGTSNGTAGINSLTSSDFLNLMLTQLEQQDPLNPTDSNQMLSQISQISNLQANTAMQTSLSSLTLQQSIGAGGNLIGKSITGVDSSGTTVTGNVTSVQVQNSQVYLGLDSDTNPVPMSSVTNIQSLNNTTLANTTLSNPTLANNTVGNTTLQNFYNVLSGIL
jgi:flagellar basal-body rod modification protein FlgD